MTRALLLGLLLLGQMLLQPALAIGKPKLQKTAKKPVAAPASRVAVTQATDDESPGSRQQQDPKKKKK